MITIPPQLISQQSAEPQGMLAPPMPDQTSMMMAAGEMAQSGAFDKYDNRTGDLGPPLAHHRHARWRNGR